MTENAVSQAVHNLCTSCALVVVLGAGAAQAGAAWDMFVVRCLDPFEHQAEPVVSGLDPVTRGGARLVYEGADGLVLVLDAAPEDGLRACSVGQGGVRDLDAGYLEWVDRVTRSQVYAPDDGMLVSREWIEPQVHVEAFIDAGRAVYRVLETDLES